MWPIGPLMWEHRLIERMVGRIEAELDRIKTDQTVDPVFVDVVVDFFRTYADRCHHGKEEDILFRDLQTKQMPKDLERIMNELVEEHKFGRSTVRSLLEAKNRFVAGQTEALPEVVAYLEKLIQFYPAHIEKEDKHFFYPVMDLFEKDEKDRMLDEFHEFDRKMIHEKYGRVVEDL